MTLKCLFLGTGSSLGVPLIGCNCKVCLSDDSKDKRLRSSILLTVEKRKVLVDAGPDFRAQALEHGLTDLDGLVYTHAHEDHIGGMDDLRPLLFKRHEPLPVLLMDDTFEEIRKRFWFLFENGGWFSSKLSTHVLQGNEGDVMFIGLKWKVFTYRQFGMNVLGLRVGDFAYITDIRDYEDSIFDHLRGVDTLVLSGVRLEPNFVHFSLSEAVAFSQKVKAKRTYLTHIAHEVDREKALSLLPSGVSLAYDGLEIVL